MATKTLVSVTALGKAALVALLVSGCATDPAHIKPVAYAGDKCTAADRAHLAQLSEEQKRTASRDVAGVFWLGLPVGSMSGGNHAKEIARLKGACRA